MYLIRLASGREATFPTIQELARAIQRGDVDRDALIFHRRTGEWLPIERHPHFYAQVSDEDAPTRDEPGTLASRETLDKLEPIAPTPLELPTPVPPPPTPSREPVKPPPSRAGTLAPATRRPAKPEPEPESERAPGRIAPEPLAEPRRRIRWRFVFAGLLLVAGALGGLAIGWRLRPAESDASEGGYQPAPPPSSLLRPESTPAEPRSTPPAIRPSRDPLGPVSAQLLGERRTRAYAASRAQLTSELSQLGFDNVLGVRSFATSEGARAGRRTIASALNVIGQFHRREVMMDRAYRDTAAYQTTRAGWSLAERRSWDGLPSLREPYAAADLAESLLSDADSLLAILAAAGSYEVRGDTVHFGNAELAAAFRAQRARIADRSGPPVSDPDLRPTLTLVRRSIDPALLPAGAP